jgi:hypothetical protein
MKGNEMTKKMFFVNQHEFAHSPVTLEILRAFEMIHYKENEHFSTDDLKQVLEIKTIDLLFESVHFDLLKAAQEIGELFPDELIFTLKKKIFLDLLNGISSRK